MNRTASKGATQSNDKGKRYSENPQEQVVDGMLLVIVVKWTQRCNCKQKQHNKGVREKSEEKQEGN